MDYVNDIEKVLEYVQKYKQSNQEIVVRMGLRMNGDLHIGNILPILSCFILGEKIIKLGYKYKIVIALVDVEDSGEQIPFIYQKDPSKKYKSLADYSIGKIKSFVEDVQNIKKNIRVEFHRVSNLLENLEFRGIIEDFLSQKKHGSQINVLCNKCKSINRDWSILDKGISFTCEFCSLNQILKLSEVEFAVDHDLLGAMEDSFFPLDIHIIGRDHELTDTNNRISSFEKREFYASYFLRHREYITFLTPLVLGRNKKKMSKSKKKGIFLERLKKQYGAEYATKLYDFSKKIIGNQNEIINLNFVIENLLN
ncbi:MAG: hypothetical protein U9R34_07005 [Nanoarchaeota archaeon]|nr:hypothetical protein [Nanoarchaeota archaeon]